MALFCGWFLSLFVACVGGQRLIDEVQFVWFVLGELISVVVSVGCGSNLRLQVVRQ
jgi:hypothetical protein